MNIYYIHSQAQSTTISWGKRHPLTLQAIYLFKRLESYNFSISRILSPIQPTSEPIAQQKYYELARLSLSFSVSIQRNNQQD